MPRRLVMLAALATLTAAGLGTLGALATPAPASACTLGVGGSGDPSSTHLPISQPYTPVPWAAPGIPSDESQAQGRAALEQAIARARAECPSRSISVVGYSAGSQIAGDICDADHSVRCTLIADPRRPGSTATNYPSLIPGYTNPSPRPARSNETQVCNSHDWVCDGPSLFTDPVGAGEAVIGAFTNRHTSYYQGVNEPAAPPAPPAPISPKVVEPVVQAIVPDVPIRDTYQPTPWVAYVPPVLQPVVQLLPPEVKAWTPPPVQLPALPPLPHL